MRKAYLLIAIVFLLVAAVAVAGCGASAPPQAEQVSEEPSTEEASDEAPASTDPSHTVTMNGRSVMGGWMVHWGFDWNGPVSENGYTFDYKELDGAEMPGSFAENVSGLAPGSVVFFKFCFADFDGSNLAQREDEIEQVISKAREKGLKLIIGNALPVRAEEGSPELREEYEQFNAFLQEQAAANPDVWIYDFYSVLAGPDGFLKGEYETEDSHPNDGAYSALDPSFFELLSGVFAGGK